MILKCVAVNRTGYYIGGQNAHMERVLSVAHGLYLSVSRVSLNIQHAAPEKAEKYMCRFYKTCLYTECVLCVHIWTEIAASADTASSLRSLVLHSDGDGW